MSRYRAPSCVVVAVARRKAPPDEQPVVDAPEAAVDQVQRLELLPDVELMSESRAPILVVCNEIPVVANRILALLDIVVPAAPFRFVFRRCRWVIDAAGGRIEMAGEPFEFLSDTDSQKFQRIALHAVREQIDALPTATRKRR
jgi:hypothetical protein